jgi:hypothetical protein
MPSAIKLRTAGVCVMLPALRKVVAEQRPIARRSSGLFGMM